MRKALLVTVCLLVLTLTACAGTNTATEPGTKTSSGTQAERQTPTSPPNAAALADQMRQQLDRVTKFTVITENNDPNNLIGRPNGYASAAVLYDPDAKPTDRKPGVDQGATIEVFPTAADAQQRSRYIQKILDNGGGFLGTEYHYPSGAALLRVSGTLKPSVAKSYEKAWKQVSEGD